MAWGHAVYDGWRRAEDANVFALQEQRTGGPGGSVVLCIRFD